MEAIELDLAERAPPTTERITTYSALLAAGLQADPLTESVAGYFSHDYRVRWIPARNLFTQEEVWIPSSAAYFCEPALCRTSTNGLASGNDEEEALLFALYEVIERDAVARAFANQASPFESCDAIDLHTLSWRPAADIVSQLEGSTTRLHLAELHSGLAVPTYWAVLSNSDPLAQVTRFCGGFGTHLDHQTAILRAIGEAVQSRLTVIHGSRDDIVEKKAYASELGRDAATEADALADAFRNLPVVPDPGERCYQGTLSEALRELLTLLQASGHRRMYVVSLPNPCPQIATVKVIAPTLLWNRALF